MEVAAIQMGGVNECRVYSSINWDCLDLQPRWRSDHHTQVWWSTGYGGHLSTVVTWVWWSPGCDGHLGMVVTWVWWSPGCDGHLGMVVTWVWWSPGYGGHLGIVGSFHRKQGHP